MFMSWLPPEFEQIYQTISNSMNSLDLILNNIGRILQIIGLLGMIIQAILFYKNGLWIYNRAGDNQDIYYHRRGRWNRHLTGFVKSLVLWIIGKLVENIIENQTFFIN